MKKQTAVEWLVNKLDSFHPTNGFLEIIDQAKAMEKEQIIDANNIGYSACKRHSDETAEQYYTSTYE